MLFYQQIKIWLTRRVNYQELRQYSDVMHMRMTDQGDARRTKSQLKLRNRYVVHLDRDSKLAPFQGDRQPLDCPRDIRGRVWWFHRVGSA